MPRRLPRSSSLAASIGGGVLEIVQVDFHHLPADRGCEEAEAIETVRLRIFGRA